MSRRLAVLVSLVFAFLFASIASAKRPTVPARMDASMKATADDSAAEVVKVKKGDALTTLGSQSGWTKVMTAAGKQGWVKNDVVVDPSKTTAVNTGNTTTVAAAEGSTAGAMRGKPGKLKTIVLATGGTTLDTAKRVADLLRKDTRLDVVDVKTAKEPLAGNGVDAAKQLAAAKKGQLVITVASGAGGSLGWQVIDVRNDGALLGNGATDSTTDPKKPVDDAATAIKAVIPSTNAAAVASPAAAASPEASPMMNPNAPLPMASPATSPMSPK
jgi:hypothetical protein